MPWTFYKSTDQDAPVLTGQADSLIALLDACLVNGYGSGANEKAAAGWSKAFTGTNKAAYRAGAAARARFFVRVENTNQNGLLTTWETMSSVDDGSGRVPLASGQANSYILVAASASADSTPRPWVIIADSRTAILLIKHGGQSSHGTHYTSAWTPSIFGEIVSYRHVDPYQFGIFGSPYDFGFDSAILDTWSASSTLAGRPGMYLSRDHTGLPGSKPVAVIPPFGVGGIYPESQYGKAIQGRWGAVNPADAKVWMVPIALREWTGTTRCIRGHLRGIRWAICNYDSYADGDVVTDGEGLPWTYYRCRMGYVATFSQTFEEPAGIFVANNLPPVS